MHTEPLKMEQANQGYKDRLRNYSDKKRTTISPEVIPKDKRSPDTSKLVAELSKGQKTEGKKEKEKQNSQQQPPQGDNMGTISELKDMIAGLTTTVNSMKNDVADIKKSKSDYSELQRQVTETKKAAESESF